MREVADRERIHAFMTALARHATADVDVFLVGGTSAVLVGWRATTIDVHAMHAHGLINADRVREQFARMEPELFWYPAIDPPSFQRAVDAVFAPQPQ